MSILTAIFGGSEQKSKSTSQSTQQSQQDSSSQSTSTPTDVTAEPFKNLQQPLADAVLPLLNYDTTPGYQGPLSAPVGANEQAVLDALMGQMGPRDTLLNSTMAGTYTNPVSNPFLNDYIVAAQRPTVQALEETLSRTLPSLFGRAGHVLYPGATSLEDTGSSPFARAGAIATRDTANALGDIAAKIGFGAYDAERQRQQEAVQLSQAEVDTTIKNLQAQALPRLVQDLGIERGLDEWKTRLTAVLNALQTAGQITNEEIATTAQSTSEAQGTSSGQSTSASTAKGSSTGGIIPGISSLIGSLPIAPR